MEVKEDAPTTRPFGWRETTEAEERGAGGKLEKPTARRPPATPYARPPQSLSQRSRWLSMLVDPARHLISGIPSIFSRPQSPASADLSAQTVEELPHDELDAEVEDEEQGNVSGDKDGDSNLNQVVSVSENVAGTSRVGDASKSSLDLDRCEQRQEVDTSEHVKLSHIEQLLNGRRFSRAEVDRLIEIMRSRSVDSSDILPELALRKTGSTQERLEILHRAITGTGTGTGNSSPLHQSTMQCNVGNSPVEIARAYMKNRISEPGFGSHGVISKDEVKFGPSDELIASPYPKPAAYWPGAVVQDQHHFMTPQNARRIGLHNFPRTPYSRTTYSKPKSKLIQFKGDGEKCLNLMSTPFEQLRGPAFGGVNSPANAFDGGYGSLGPICRTRHKVDVETPRVSSDFGSFRSSNFSPAQVENSNASHGFFSTVSENLEAGTSSSSKLPLVHSKPHSSEVSVPTVPTHSSQIARKILEHLDRNPPTPKDKSAELKLAISWKKPDMPNTTFNILKQNNSDIGYLDSSDKADNNLKNSTVPLFGGKEVSHPKVLAVEAANEPNNSTSASSMNVGRTSSHLGASPDFRKYQDSQIMGKQEDVSKVASNASSSELPGMQKKPPLSGTRSALSAISISKPDQKWAFPSDNSSGFTFPVSASSGALYEPPTPSIAPSSLVVSGQYPQKEVLSIPSYSFGSSRSLPALVFSFPLTSNSPVHNDTPDPKFTFGSDQGTRISFSSIGYVGSLKS